MCVRVNTCDDCADLLTYVRLCVCEYVCTCVCTCVCMCVCIPAFAAVSPNRLNGPWKHMEIMSVCMCVCLCVCVCVCVCVWGIPETSQDHILCRNDVHHLMYTHTHTHTHIHDHYHTHAHTHTHTYTHIHTYMIITTHIHTHTHTHLPYTNAVMPAWWLYHVCTDSSS